MIAQPKGRYADFIEIMKNQRLAILKFEFLEILRSNKARNRRVKFMKNAVNNISQSNSRGNIVFLRRKITYLHEGLFSLWS